jgi:PhnB protein
MKGPMRPGSVVSVNLFVRDWRPAVPFYEAAFGFSWNDEIAAFQFGEYPDDDFFLVGLLDPTDDPRRPVGGGQLGFLVQDLEWAHRRALDAGAREWFAPMHNAGSPRSSGVKDPDGNRIELVQA